MVRRRGGKTAKVRCQGGERPSSGRRCCRPPEVGRAPRTGIKRLDGSSWTVRIGLEIKLSVARVKMLRFPERGRSEAGKRTGTGVRTRICAKPGPPGTAVGQRRALVRPVPPLLM